MVNRCAFIKMLLKSRADSTAKKYIGEIRRFLAWCKENSVADSYPFSSTVVTLYLFQLFAHRNKSYSVLVMVHAALKWFHSFVPLNGPNPLDDACAKNVLQSAKRRKENPTSKKEPVSTELVKKIINRFAPKGASLKDLRIAALCTLGFAGFFRFNELGNMLCKHIAFFDDHIKIFVPHSKTDVYREGNFVYIAKTHSEYCPVSILLRYMREAKLSPTSDLPLFSPLSKTKSGYVMRSSKLSYSRCREVFKEALGVLGCDPKVYGLHSLRSGGITSVVKNDKEVSERLLKLHGRWKTDVAKDMYVKEADYSRLSVSRSLGL